MKFLKQKEKGGFPPLDIYVSYLYSLNLTHTWVVSFKPKFVSCQMIWLPIQTYL